MGICKCPRKDIKVYQRITYISILEAELTVQHLFDPCSSLSGCQGVPSTYNPCIGNNISPCILPPLFHIHYHS